MRELPNDASEVCGRRQNYTGHACNRALTGTGKLRHPWVMFLRKKEDRRWSYFVANAALRP
jgi:hypothetical protein